MHLLLLALHLLLVASSEVQENEPHRARSEASQCIATSILPKSPVHPFIQPLPHGSIPHKPRVETRGPQSVEAAWSYDLTFSSFGLPKRSGTDLVCPLSVWIRLASLLEDGALDFGDLLIGEPRSKPKPKATRKATRKATKLCPNGLNGQN